MDFKKILFVLLLIQSFTRIEASHFEKDMFLSRLNFPEKKGSLPPPIVNPLIKKLNLNKALNQDFLKFKRRGHFYKLNQREKVRAVAIGRVVFNSSIQGYGSTLIIDHGKNYYSVYGNLGKVFIEKGSLVRAGEVIGRLGSKHLQFKMGLYFEIRHFSEPLKLSEWLKSNPFVKQKNGKGRYEKMDS